MSDRIQREIEDILSTLEGFPPKRSLWWRLRNRVTVAAQSVRSSFQSLPWPRISLGQIMLVGVALIIITYLVDPSNSLVYRSIIGAGVGLFILAFALSLRRTSRPPDRHWRGQPMDLHGTSSGRLRSWWERWRSRR